MRHLGGGEENGLFSKQRRGPGGTLREPSLIKTNSRPSIEKGRGEESHGTLRRSNERVGNQCKFVWAVLKIKGGGDENGGCPTERQMSQRGWKGSTGKKFVVVGNYVERRLRQPKEDRPVDWKEG